MTATFIALRSRFNPEVDGLCHQSHLKRSRSMALTSFVDESARADRFWSSMASVRPARIGVRVSLIDSSNELILLNNRGIGGSTDDGRPFDIAKLADDAAHVIATLGIEHASMMGWSMGGFIAQAFAVKYADRVDKLVLLSTDPGGIEADLASPDVWFELAEHVRNA